MTRILSTLAERLDELAAIRPEHTAYVFLDEAGQEKESLSYAALRRSSLSLAARMAEKSAPGDRVLLLCSGRDFVVSFLAAMYAGLLPVPVARPRKGRSYQPVLAIREDCRPALAIGTPTKTDVGIPWLVPDDGCVDFEPRGSDEVAFLQYTSGSTSNPKGVKVSHANLLHNARCIQAAFRQPEGATLVSWLPLFHDMGLIGVVLQSLHLGGTAVLIEPATFIREPFRWLEAITRFRAHTSGGPNFGYELCLKRIRPEQSAALDLSGWQLPFCGAEPVRYGTLMEFHKCFSPCGFRGERFFPCYGLAESTLYVSGGPPEVYRCSGAHLEQGKVVAGGDRVITSCGRPLLGQEVSIEGRQDEGFVGEVWVKGPSLCQGYWDGTPIPDEQGWLHTGDLGFLHSGDLYLIGRSKDMVIVRGRNLHPEDMEPIVQVAHPDVHACCVFGVEENEGEKLLVAVEMRRSVDPGELVDTVTRALLDSYEVKPDAVVVLKPGGLPKTTSGKLRRSACRQLWREGKWQGATPPSSGERLQGWIARYLGRKTQEVDPEATFDDLGLDSHQRYELTGKLAELLERELAGDLTWRYTTIAALNKFLAGEDEVREHQAILLKSGAQPPLWVVPTTGGDPVWFEGIRSGMTLQDPAVYGLRQVDPEGAPLAPENISRLANDLSQVMMRIGKPPFRLLGYSYGCKLTYEIAHQLEQAGQEVDFVGLLDGYPNRHVDVALPQVIPMLARIPQWLGSLWRTRGGRAKRLKVKHAVVWVRHWFRFNLLKKDVYWDPGANLRMENVRPFLEYRPQPSNLRVTVFRTQVDLFSPLYQHQAGWGHLARGGVEVVDVPGDHFTVLTDPYRHEVLAALRRVIGAPSAAPHP